MNFYTEIISEIKKKKPSKNQLTKLKTKLCKKYSLRKIPTDIDILMNAKVKEIPRIKKYLQTKPMRSLSGVSVCAIMTKPIKCPHGRCIICPGGPQDSVFGSVPQSYTGKEPATMRAIRNKYDPYLQVMNRLEQYVALGHNINKIELIIMGGTFPSFSKQYQDKFVMYALKAMNDFSKMFFNKNVIDFTKFKKFFCLPGDVNDKKRIKRIHKRLLAKKGKSTLEKEQLKNETSLVKSIGMCIETRPDYCKEKHINQMLRLGCTRVELGVQTIFDDVLKKVRRKHNVEDSVQATSLLKNTFLKVGFHMMVGLPGSTIKKDKMMFHELFSNQNFKPDALKIYPCMVIEGTQLYKMWKKGLFEPLDTQKAAELVVELKKIVPKYCRIMRVQRDIPSKVISAGVDKTNLRQYIQMILNNKKIKCNCIRCKEPKNIKIKMKNVILKKYSYKASNGMEVFISAEDIKNNKLVGFCRLRVPLNSFRKEIDEDSAGIRELHVYGKSTGIGEEGDIQHRGIGKRLMKRAEDIAKTVFDRNKMVVISGIGVRGYYKKLGYKREGPYMVKYLNK